MFERLGVRPLDRDDGYRPAKLLIVQDYSAPKALFVVLRICLTRPRRAPVPCTTKWIGEPWRSRLQVAARSLRKSDLQCA